MARIAALRVVTYLLFMAMASLAQCAADEAGAVKQTYSALVAAVKSGEDVDFAALREAYAQSPDYDPYGGNLSQKLRDMMQFAGSGDCGKAVSLADSILETNFIIHEAHFALSICSKEAGDDAKERYERKIALGLIASILASGNGKTPQTAFRVVTISEEYSILGIMKLQKTSQALITYEGHDYDRIDAVREGSDAALSVYFRVDGFLDRTRRQFQSRQDRKDQK